MILYRENHKDSTKKLSELINEFSKIAGCKISNVSDTNSKLSKREIKKIISFIIASKRIKYLGMNLTKEV